MAEKPIEVLVSPGRQKKPVATAGAVAALGVNSTTQGIQELLLSVWDLDHYRDESVFGWFTTSYRESKGRSLAYNWQAKFMNFQAFFFKNQNN